MPAETRMASCAVWLFFLGWISGTFASPSAETTPFETQLLELSKRVNDIESREKSTKATMTTVQHLLRRQDRLVQQLRRQAMAKDRVIKAMQDKLNNIQSPATKVESHRKDDQNKSNSAWNDPTAFKANPDKDIDLNRNIKKPTKERIVKRNDLFRTYNGDKENDIPIKHRYRRLDPPGEVQSSQVAFHALIKDSTIGHMFPGDHVMFDIVQLNVGNGYHAAHGVFIAPRAGIYLFSVSILSTTRPNQYVEVTMQKNGNRLGMAYANGSDSVNRLDQGSITLAVELDVGDEIWVQYDHPEDGVFAGYYGSSFTGILINSYS